MKALSLFSNIGVGEAYLHDLGIEVIVANELEEDRAEFYKKLYPDCNMICGDITDPAIYEQIKQAAEDVDLIIATPPCQGMSIANAKRADKNDPRNSLIKKVVNFINDLSPSHILIENVSGMAKTYIQHNNQPVLIMDYIKKNIPKDYTINYKVLNASDYGTPQHRKRLITLISKVDKWEHPTPQEKVFNVKESIGHLPSIESGEKTDIPWHFGRKHNDNHILWMKHTPTGNTAFSNSVHYPKTKDKVTGKLRRIKGFATTYKRIKWDEPAPTVGMTNGSINSQNNVHPGTLNKDGTYSDARVLSVREILILCGLPAAWLDAHQDQKENFIRKVLGECFPPKFCAAILSTIPSLEEQ